jgi:hypothetical protein
MALGFIRTDSHMGSSQDYRQAAGSQLVSQVVCTVRSGSPHADANQINLHALRGQSVVLVIYDNIMLGWSECANDLQTVGRYHEVLEARASAQ